MTKLIKLFPWGAWPAYGRCSGADRTYRGRPRRDLRLDLVPWRRVPCSLILAATRVCRCGHAALLLHLGPHLASKLYRVLVATIFIGCHRVGLILSLLMRGDDQTNWLLHHACFGKPPFISLTSHHQLSTSKGGMCRRKIGSV